MTGFDGMDAVELRAVLEEWHERVVGFAREYRAAVQSGQLDWEIRAGAELDTALLMVRRVSSLLKLGVAA